jgi:hypothetical protein
MNSDKRLLVSKLDNHQKLLSMVSDKVLPIKQTLINDVIEIKRDLEVAFSDRLNRNSRVNSEKDGK